MVLAAPLCFAFAQQTMMSQRPADIVDLAEIDPSIRIDMMYASSGNFIGAPVDGYNVNICYLTINAAIGLKQAQRRLP